MRKIYFITGASGAGKTTLVKDLERKKKNNSEWSFGFFDTPVFELGDSFGVDNRPGGAYQRAMAVKWIEVLLHNNTETIVFEGQVNLDFIIEGFEKVGFNNYEITFMYCDPKVMKQRLIGREQEELFTQDMINRNSFLYKQAVEKGVAIINSSELSREEMYQEFKRLINKK